MIITKVEASGYRCLRDVRQELKPYQILVGPNGSGKSAFLDVIAFLGDLVAGGIQGAVAKRTDNFYDLLWGRTGTTFRLAVEARENEDERGDSNGLIRYEMTAKIDTGNDLVIIASERLSATDASGSERQFKREGSDQTSPFRVPPNHSILSQMATSSLELAEFRSMAHFENLLFQRVKTVALDAKSLRAPSPPGLYRGGVYDGSTLPRGMAQIDDSASFKTWIEHIQTAIPEITGIRVVDRPEDRHRYLMIKYADGVEVPQWMLSDGTLRLLALTLLAYLPDFRGIYLIEEPEIGLHPTAIETVMQSLSSVYEGQVLITSHSPLVLSLARPDQMLCFQKTDDGTAIIPGNQHPMLSQWKSDVNISDLFAAGVLG